MRYNLIQSTPNEGKVMSIDYHNIITIESRANVAASHALEAYGLPFMTCFPGWRCMSRTEIIEDFPGINGLMILPRLFLQFAAD